jgi:excisionase family DNA binding protein
MNYACERLGVTDKTLRRWIAEGRLTAWRLGPKLVRLDRDDVNELLRPIPTESMRGPAE